MLRRSIQSSFPAIQVASGLRAMAGSSVPEHWGRPSKYTEGTEFLGTPKNHQDLLKKRPTSPHVFDMEKPVMFHYKFPITALTSVANRATGCALYGMLATAGFINLTGDLPSAIEAFKAAAPILVPLSKLVITYPLVYHWMAGLRHLYWDHFHYPNMIVKSSPLEKTAIPKSSTALVGASVAVSLALAMM